MTGSRSRKSCRTSCSSKTPQRWPGRWPRSKPTRGIAPGWAPTPTVRGACGRGASCSASSPSSSSAGWPDPNGNAAGGPSMWLMIAVVVLGLPVLFVMMRFTPRKGGWPSSGLVGGPDGRGDHHPFAAGQRGGDWPVLGYTIQAARVVDGTHPRRERGSLGRRRPHLVQRRGAARHLPRERFNRLGVVI